MSVFVAATALLSMIEQGARAYREIRRNNEQSRELTPEQEAELDAKEEAIFTSDAADPDLNA